MVVCAECDSEAAPGRPFCSRCGTSLQGTLERADQPASRQSIKAEVAGGRLVLYSATGRVGDWSLAEIRLARALEGFSLLLDGVEMRLTMEDFPRFWGMVTEPDQDLDEHLQAPPEPPRSQWWRFWSDDSWRAWRARRVPWVEHRQKVESLQSRVEQLSRSVEQKDDPRERERDAALLQAAERQLAEAVPPPRPISPAWVLAVTIVIVAIALGAGAADVNDADPTPPRTGISTTAGPVPTSKHFAAAAGRSGSLGQNARLDASLTR